MRLIYLFLASVKTVTIFVKNCLLIIHKSEGKNLISQNNKSQVETTSSFVMLTFSEH